MTHFYDQANEEANRQLLEVEAKIEGLIKEREALQAVVKSISSLLLIVHAPQIADSPEDDWLKQSVPPPVSFRSQPAWMSVRDVLANHPSPMNVPDIHRVLVSKGITIRPDAVRIAMLRKPDVFFKFDGRYALQSYLRNVANEDFEAGSVTFQAGDSVLAGLQVRQ